MADVDLGGIRQCAKCGIPKPWTTDYYRKSRNGEKTSLYHTCRACYGMSEGPNRRTRRYRLTDEERLVANSEWCRTWREKDPEKARRIWRESADRNMPQKREQAKRYRAANQEKVRADYAAWRERNKERLREYMREYGPKWAEANRDKTRAAVKRWRLKNPKKAHHSTQCYWARKHGAEGSHTFREKQALLERQGHRCFYCAAKLTEYHADHFVPLSRGGSDYIDNIRMACPSCNCRKSDKLPWEWMPERFAAP